MMEIKTVGLESKFLVLRVSSKLIQRRRKRKHDPFSVAGGFPFQLAQEGYRYLRVSKAVTVHFIKPFLKYLKIS